MKKVLEAEGIAVETFARDPKRPNVVARIKGNGAKRPVPIMAHIDEIAATLSVRELECLRLRTDGLSK